MVLVVFLFVFSCFLASLFNNVKLYFESWKEDEKEYVRLVDDIPDNVDYRNVGDNWDTSMIHSVTWDVCLRDVEVSEIVWRED